jgi:hypothetical protein
MRKRNDETTGDCADWCGEGEYAVRLEGGKHVGVERGSEDSGVDERRVPIVVGHDKGTSLH